MAQYLLQVAYTPDAWSAMVSNPQNRLELVRPALKALGGDLDHGWFAFGEYDIVAVISAPDNVSAAAFSIAAAAGGAVKSIRTTPLISVEEGVEAMRKAGKSGYKPPAGR
jgi:uncharacterized protein with GYD domain